MNMHETSIDTGELEIIYQFEVTPKTLGQITAIAEWRGFIQGLETVEHIDFGDLERNHEIEEAVASVCIEGASIGVQEAQTLMENEDELDMDELTKSQKELVSYLDAMRMLDDFKDCRERCIREADIRGLHKLITSGTLRPEDQGNYRKMDVIVGDKGPDGEIVERYKPPRAEELPVLMAGFVDWLDKSKDGGDKLHAAIAAGLAHFELVRIHPFKDGNGRTTRLLTTLLLLQRGYDFKKMFCITEYYNRKRDQYYDALQCVEVVEKNDKQLIMDASKWLKYFLGGLAYQVVVAKKRVQTLVENAADFNK
ncbi:Fic family protein [Acidobacteriota bacterium]